MRKSKRNNIRLGVFVTLGILIFIFAIYYIGDQSNRFGNTISINGIFKDVSGLKVGNNVRFSGINVGTVNNVSIINDTLVRVDVNVQKDIQRFIRTDSKMEIASDGLMGNKVINILSGSQDKPAVEAGATLKTLEVVKIDEILNELNTSSKNVSMLTENLVNITDKLKEGEGIFGKLFTDEAFSRDITTISKNTATLTENISSISQKINEEQGPIGKLLSDTALSKQLTVVGNNLEKSSIELAQITEKINKGEGAFGKAFTDTSFLSNLSKVSADLTYTSERSKAISANLENLTKVINEGDGLLYRVVYDTAFADSVENAIIQVNKSAKELDEAARVVKSNWLLRLFSRKKKREE